MGALYYSIIFITLSIRSLIWLFLDKAFLQKRTEKNEVCAYSTVIPASEDQIFYFLPPFLTIFLFQQTFLPSQPHNVLQICKNTKGLVPLCL